MSTFGWLREVVHPAPAAGELTPILVDWTGNPLFELRIHLALRAAYPTEAGVAAVLAGAMGTDLAAYRHVAPDVQLTAALGPTGLLIDVAGPRERLPATLHVIRSVVFGRVTDHALEQAAQTSRTRTAMIRSDPSHALGTRLLSLIGPDIATMAAPAPMHDGVIARRAHELQARLGAPGTVDAVLVADGAPRHAAALIAALGTTRVKDSRPPAGSPEPSAPDSIPAAIPGRTQIGLVSGAIPPTAADHLPLEVAHHLLGGHTHSWLSRTLRERHALSSTPEGPLHNVGSRSFALWRLDVATPDAPGVLHTLRDVTASLAEDGPGGDELIRAARELIVHDLIAAHTPSGLATTLIAYLVRGLTPDDLLEREARLAGLSTDDVRRAAARLAPEALHCVVLGDVSDSDGTLTDVAEQSGAGRDSVVTGSSGPPRPESPVVDRFGTAAWQTIVRRCGASYVWSRHRGPRCPVPPERSGGPVDALAHIHPAFAEIALPAGLDPVTVTLPGAWSLASILLGRGAKARSSLVSAAADAIARVAGWAVSAPVVQVPRPLEELHGWMSGRDDVSPGLSQLRATVENALGAERTAEVRQWIRELQRPTIPVVLHGECGLASLVPDDTQATIQLVAPDRWSAGPALFDLGWLLGEITELIMKMPPEREIEQEILFSAEGAIRAEAADPITINRIAFLRTLYHLYEYRTLVGEIPAENAEINRLIDRFDSLARVASTSANI